LTANVRLSIDQETFLPEVCGIIADGAHYGGGANGQDAYTGRIIPVLETDIVAHTLSTQSAWATEDGTGRGSPLVAVSSGRGWRSESEVGATVRAQDSANNLLAFDEQQITSKTNRSGVPLVPERFIPIVSDPITAHEIKTYTHEGKSFRLRNCVTDEQHVHDISCDLDEDCMCSPSRFVGVRRLTPRECERLQGFPDDHTLVPHRGKEAMDGPRYRAIGNSMAVNAMRWIGRRIEQVEGKR
jgi:DNA (cytosine-5)-methyltransferase 1